LFYFFFIFFYNNLGLITETIALNSIILVTLFLSFWMSFTYNFYGLSIKKEEWFNAFLPGNIPFAITPLLCAIEIVSYFIRIFSLAIRLFANILAGHILLHLLISYLSMMIKSFNFYLVIFSVIFGVLIFALTLLEWFMAFMQSAIFVLLLSMWFNENLI
jgi:F-type H+-transporting ATPase subunit a